MAERLAKKLLLIGWDGADWQIINPLLEQGEMPNLRRLVEAGVMGNLASMNPMISPMLWTTMATGKLPHVHGVCGFIEPDPHSDSGRRLVGSTSRKCKAFWNILTEEAIKTHVVGWYANHPAEPINGVCVSERFAKAHQTIDKGWPVPAGSVHPVELAEVLAGIRIHPQQIGLEHLAPLVPDAAKIDQSKDGHLMSLAKILAQCATNQAATTWIMESQEWEVVATYFNTIDLVCHSFMYFHPPRMAQVPEELFQIYRDTVNGIYRFHDMMLGRLMELAGNETTIMLVSDHGYKSGNNRPHLTPADPAGAILWHRPYGIIAIRGPHVKRDELLFGARIIDLTPTILTLMGCPVGDDMSGQPLLQAFDRPIEVARIASWESDDSDSGSQRQPGCIDPIAEMEAIKQLEALGYLEPAGADKQAVMEQAADELKYNMARLFISLGRHAEAIAELEGIVARQPRRLEAAYNLADCYQAAGRYEECRELIDRISTGSFDGHALESQSARIVPQLDYLYGLLELNSGNIPLALERFQRAEQQMANRPSRDFHKNLGQAWLRLEKWSKAGKAFEKAMHSEPDDPQTLHGLAIVALQENRNGDAAEWALQSLQILYQQPRAHFHYGIACFRLGELERAREAFEACLLMIPNARDVQEKLSEVRQAIAASQ